MFAAVVAVVIVLMMIALMRIVFRLAVILFLLVFLIWMMLAHAWIFWLVLGMLVLVAMLFYRGEQPKFARYVLTSLVIAVLVFLGLHTPTHASGNDPVDAQAALYTPRALSLDLQQHGCSSVLLADQNLINEQLRGDLPEIQARNNLTYQRQVQTFVKYIEPQCLPPIPDASFTATVLTGHQVQFISAAKGFNLTETLTSGDNNCTSKPIVDRLDPPAQVFDYTYCEPRGGTYDVENYVVDPFGQHAQVTHTVTVGP